MKIKTKKKTVQQLLGLETFGKYGLIAGKAEYVVFSILPSNIAVMSLESVFYPGIVSSENFIDTLQLDPAEYKLINKPSRSHCLYRCGNERYLLKVIAPPYKAALFGTGGGR